MTNDLKSGIYKLEVQPVLTDKEKRLIEVLRSVDFGSVEIDIRNGEVAVIHQIIKTIKL